MEENPQVIAENPGVPQEQYQKLGKKTLMIFILDRIQAPFILLILSIVLFIVQGQPFLAQIQIPNLGHYIGFVAWACFALFVIFLLLSLLIAWLIYINYKFCLGEDSLRIKRGILNKEEIAIPYRQIQDVDIDRDLTFRMMGVSRIVILTAGHEDPRGSGDDPLERGQSEGYLPALDRDLAEWLQAQLLKRTNVQKVVQVQ
jgi:uncharacterized membrane protein YdbT with pleckstrin-like domain